MSMSCSTTSSPLRTLSLKVLEKPSLSRLTSKKPQTMGLVYEGYVWTLSRKAGIYQSGREHTICSNLTSGLRSCTQSLCEFVAQHSNDLKNNHSVFVSPEKFVLNRRSYQDPLRRPLWLAIDTIFINLTLSTMIPALRSAHFPTQDW